MAKGKIYFKGGYTEDIIWVSDNVYEKNRMTSFSFTSEYHTDYKYIPRFNEGIAWGMSVDFTEPGFYVYSRQIMRYVHTNLIEKVEIHPYALMEFTVDLNEKPPKYIDANKLIQSLEDSKRTDESCINKIIDIFIAQIEAEPAADVIELKEVLKND